MQISNEEYKQLKPLLFSLGYRLLGSVTDAEDLVQDVFLKAFQINEQDFENKKAYLCKMMTNRCLDLLRSARYKREHYVGPWLPEPMLLEHSHPFSLDENVIQKEGLSIAYLRMMEHLTPPERAVLLLREVFDFPYLEIANIIEKSEANCRKIFSRAKQKISQVEGESLNYDKNKSIVNRFIQAFQMQNTEALLELISENVTLYSDGGGVVKTAVKPIVSLPNVLALLYGIMKKSSERLHFEVNNVNNQPAILFYENDKLFSIFSFYIVHDKIEEMYNMMNPEKLPINT